MVVVDFGNTNIKIILNEQIHYVSNTKSEYAIEDLNKKLRELKVKEIIVVNVTAQKELLDLINVKYTLFNNEDIRKYVVFSEYDISRFGNDRIANIYAYKQFNRFEENFVIIDFGTFITLDVVSNNIYQYGEILLGNKSQISAMSQFSDNIRTNPSYVMKERNQTDKQIKLGIEHMMRSWIDSICDRYPNHEIVITGHDLDLVSGKRVTIMQNLLGYLTKKHY